IRGGMLGQILGNLNGLPHEMKYIHDPGEVTGYVPALPDGARTDDDTDLEWVYVSAIQRRGEPLVPHAEVAQLWRRHINEGIWCANRFARSLMELGFEPPLTGSAKLNPWSSFNLSGQFVCESFGLMAPAMPQTAARVGLHYTQAAVEGEPLETTRLFTTMIAMAFVEPDMDALLDAGVAAVDPRSDVASLVTETRQLHRRHPDDWRAARLRIKQRWQRHNGDVRDWNGYELNTACTVAALLYGRGDVADT
ncbi:MAG TPA: ADP-ribosylglycohydrolase family protein, partial [Lacipirellulaceae bacterium]|nr:ADP-ribosylglycohydrolase family protein [Lacipirellulaceae bacterium]